MNIIKYTVIIKTGIFFIIMVTVQVGSYSDMKLLQIFYFYLLFTR